MGSPKVTPCVALLDHEGGDALRARAGRDGRKEAVVLGQAAVRDPGLLAVEPVAAGGALGGGGHGRGVGADAGLGRAERRERRHIARERGEPALLLLGRADLDERAGEEAGRGDQVADAGAAPVELLLHQAAGEHVLDASAADLLGQHERGEAELGRLVHDLDRAVRVALVDVRRNRADLGARKLTCERLDFTLLIGQLDHGGGEFSHGRHASRPAKPAASDAAHRYTWTRYWRGGRVVECGGLENRCASYWRTGGSNPPLSASGRFARSLSRARLIRDRTVPTGMSSASAISP